MGTEGFSLFEVLIALSILALVVTISVSSFRPPSDKMLLNKVISDFISEVSEARLHAIRSDQVAAVEISDCRDELVELDFYPDGTAAGGEVCLASGQSQGILQISPLTGQVTVGLDDE
ncbi:Tfp pilus assembly protein FimT/FimU [Ruegeria sp. EL01]|jgi:prepilin-type N-terminal cleavage/methylation domain-containing protein|uniref:pilus assembly FimT family protein n=1 Tax=Ruegeria sp. EL01 TaxID=2107578 RepID=UPI0013C3F2A8|nr:prepilin-type N-terminal cleavage/methylation domain-containing protein [Ruegeria sp. EL01]